MQMNRTFLTRRRAVMALLTMPLGYYKAFGQSKLPVGPATLTVNLDQWAGIEVGYKGKKTFVTAAEIFAALEER